jgi:hypothetical protein
MLRRVALVRTDASEECIASIIGVIRIGELETMLLIIVSFLHTSLMATSATFLLRWPCFMMFYVAFMSIVVVLLLLVLYAPMA